MEILLTSASETCSLRIPPDRTSTADTYNVVEKKKILPLCKSLITKKSWSLRTNSTLYRTKNIIFNFLNVENIK